MNDAEAESLALTHNLECIVTLPQGLGLTTATPLQRAICRVATGEPLGELARHPHVIEAVGRLGLLWGEQPEEVYLLAPSRTGKSTIVAGLALRATQTVDLAAAGNVEGERPRFTIISLDIDLAKAIFGVISRALRGPFRHLMVREPLDSKGLAVVRHPSGREVEIVVAAGKAGGAAVLSRWCIGLALDEATRMHGDEKQVSIKQTRTAALDRLLPGAQIVYLGSKWASYGPVYDAAKRYGGIPNQSQSVVVIGWEGCRADHLNPLKYQRDTIAALKAKEDGESAWRVAMNLWQTPPQNMFSLAYLQRLCRPAVPCDCDTDALNSTCPHNDSPPHDRQHYLAIIDPATRGNAWTLTVLTVREIGITPAPVGDVLGYRDDVALCRQWQGSSDAPIDPDATFKTIAELLRPYRCNRVVTDQWSADALRAIALQHGLYLAIVTTTMAQKVDAFDGVKSALAMTERGKVDRRSLELHPCPALLADLSRVERRTTLSGVVVELPLTSDGRHCDYAAALALGYTQVLQRPDAASVHEPPDQRRDREERERMAEAQARGPEDDDSMSYEGCDYGDE